jgi:esterase/lipase superfamily enzyme
MAHHEHIAKLEQGVEAWNLWVKDMQGVTPDLSKAELCGWNLSNIDFRNTNLTEADLSVAKLDGANLTGAKLKSAYMRETRLVNADLSGVDLTGATLCGALLQDARLTNAILHEAILTGADLTAATLTGADLSGANLRWADLTGVDLSGVDTSSAIFEEVDLSFAMPLVLVEGAGLKPFSTETSRDDDESRGADDEQSYTVWYGTNRKPAEIEDAPPYYTVERDTEVHHGVCRVTIPASHEIGTIGSSWWKRLLKLTDDRLKTSELVSMEEESFWRDLGKFLLKLPRHERMALVYIHGFKVSFEDAALRAAQLGFDLQIPGAMAFFSWPSRALCTLRGYSSDEATIEASERHITEFLIRFAAESNADSVNIIAHSMGNRGLLRAMQRIISQAERAGKVKFGQIFLAAPDVDIDTFRELAGAYPQLSERTTLYISDKDRALLSSGLIHTYPRAGFTPPVTVVQGIDTVEVSNIDLTLLGHGYYSGAHEVLRDMHALLRHNDPPSVRFGLNKVALADGIYWVIGK